jgi:glycosyltransferase involved in cell wall biosynthesis
MKVAVDVSAIPARPAGAGVYVMRVVEALARTNTPDLELELVARARDGERWRMLAPRAEVRAVAPSPRPVRLVWEQVAGPALAHGADVWHGPHYTMPLLAWTPSVVTIHDLTFFDHPEWHEQSKVKFFRRMIRLSTRRAKVLICASERTADLVRERFRPRAPIIMAPHGVDPRFRPTGENVDIALPERYVAFVGTIEPRKNIAGLVRAMSRLDPSIQLVIAGQSGWGDDEVERVIESTGMRSRVVRLGYVPDDVVPTILRRAAAVAYPSFEEGFGLPALEALACGAPLVTTSDTVMSDIAGRAALLVPSGDEDALVDALRSLVDGGAEAERLRAAGPAVASRYTWTVSAERHLEAYRIASGS